jgi:hypothetical protein
MTCSTCHAERPLANLTDGVCPECLHRAAMIFVDFKKQRSLASLPTPPHGLVVVDVPRSFGPGLRSLHRATKTYRLQEEKQHDEAKARDLFE